MGTDGKNMWDLEKTRFNQFEGMAEAEVTIIGGGLTGLTLACHLKRYAPKKTILLLEADQIGSGASGRSGGILMDGTASDDYPGTDRAVDSLRELIEREAIDCELRTNGCFEMDRQPRWNGERPIFNDSGRLGPVQTVSGGDFHPQKFVTGLARRIADRGGSLFERSPVVAIDPGPVTQVLTPGGVVKTEWLISATNTDLWQQLKIENQFTPYSTYAIASEPLSRSCLAEIGWGEELPFYTLSLPFLWGRTTLEGRVVIGAGLSPIKKIKVEMLEELEERFHNLHPALQGVSIEYRWWGPIGIPHDWTPKILTSPLHPKILYIGGYAGHGCALSNLFAERTAAYLAGEEGALEIFSWAQSPSPRLLPFSRTVRDTLIRKIA